MKCPSCGYVSFQNSEECVKCGVPVPPSADDGEVTSDSDFRRGVKRKGREQLGFSFPSDDDESGLPTAAETQATVAKAAPAERTAERTATKSTVRDTGAQLPEWSQDGTFTTSEDSSYGSGTHWHEDQPSDGGTWVEVYKLASGFGRRAMALLVDTAVFILFAAVLVFALRGENGAFEIVRAQNMPAFFFLLVLHGFYYTFFHSLIGQTPGKMLFGIRVVHVAGGTLLSPWDAFLRWLGYFLSALPFGFGFLWAVLDNDDQAVHDKWAKSVVVLVDSFRGAPGAPAEPAAEV